MMIGTSKSNVNIHPSTQSVTQGTTSSKKLRKPSGTANSSKTDIRSATIDSTKSLPGEYEDLREEELGEETEIETRLPEPDIQYTYVVPKGMVDIRTGHKTFSDGKRPEQYQKLGMKLPTIGEFGKQ